MKKVKILHVLGGLYCGGTEAYVMNMFRAIDKEKFQFDFLVHEKCKAYYDDEVLLLGGTIHRIPDRTEVGTLKYIILLFKALNLISPDVVHSHSMFHSGAVMFTAFLAKIKTRIVHSHSTADQGGNNLKRKTYRLLSRILILLFSTEFLACSKDSAKYLYGNRVQNTEKTTVLNNAIDVNLFQYNAVVRRKVRKELKVEGKLVIGHVGRFTEVKNHDFLIDVFYSLNVKNPNSILVLVGDGPLKPDMEKKVEKLGLKSAVKFLGIRSDIPELMQCLDILLLPSLFEGFPVVLTEAQGAGLFCIVADTITTDVDLTGRVKFLDIKKSVDIWTKEILSANIPHIDTSELIKQKGFDNDTNAKKLGEIYLTNIS